MKLLRFMFYMFLLVVVLVLVNIFLMIYMTQNGINRLDSYGKFNFDYKVNEDSLLSIHDLPEDGSGEYYIHKNFIRAENMPSKRDIVLASHCTGDHLHHLVSLTDVWEGSLSIAVFVPGYSLKKTLWILYMLYGCFTKVRRQVTIHFVHPISALLKETDLMYLVQQSQQVRARCSKALEMIKNINKNVDKNYEKKLAYPNNLLRNTAKCGVKSPYTLVIDIDMKPNKNLYKDFITFAKRNNLFDGGNSFYDDRSVFVLPAFEMDTTRKDSTPEDKAELITLLDSGVIRPFYYEICWKCQKHTDYEKWRSLDNAVESLNVGYEVEWQDPWEPFFISPMSAPDYDERFKQYGFNRISHACELHVAGYKYFILDKGFLLHQAFKDKTSFHSTKNDENEKNRILFRSFKTELRDKYPESMKRC